jgi:hypothetical protein
MKDRKSPAIGTANRVIASAKRLTVARHDWRVSTSREEISVPALPRPIHQT